MPHAQCPQCNAQLSVRSTPYDDTLKCANCGTSIVFPRLREDSFVPHSNDLFIDITPQVQPSPTKLRSSALDRAKTYLPSFELPKWTHSWYLFVMFAQLVFLLAAITAGYYSRHLGWEWFTLLLIPVTFCFSVALVFGLWVTDDDMSSAKPASFAVTILGSGFLFPLIALLWGGAITTPPTLPAFLPELFGSHVHFIVFGYGTASLAWGLLGIDWGDTVDRSAEWRLKTLNSAGSSHHRWATRRELWEHHFGAGSWSKKIKMSRVAVLITVFVAALVIGLSTGSRTSDYVAWMFGALLCASLVSYLWCESKVYLTLFVLFAIGTLVGACLEHNVGPRVVFYGILYLLDSLAAIVITLATISLTNNLRRSRQ